MWRHEAVSATDVISHLPKCDVRHSKDLLCVVHQRLQDLLTLVVLRG